MEFVGRQEYFHWLDGQFEQVSATAGRFVALRGRRQVGKSRLLTEWLARRGHRNVYHQALGRPVEQELSSFAAAIARSTLGRLSDVVAAGAVWTTWEAAFDAVSRAGAGGPLGDGPAVVVLDELSYLVQADPAFEATLQAAWDHKLQHTGLLLIVVGSDLAMMEALTSHGRPLYQRAVPKQVAPLNAAEVGEVLGVDAVTAIDAYLMTGGFPKVVASRVEHPDQRSFLEAAARDEAHPLVYTGTQMLGAEFPSTHRPRDVLEAIGAGERSFGKISTRSGATQATVNAALTQLQDARVVTRLVPRGARPIAGRARYVVSDPYLRFWLRFLADRSHDIARGRGDLVVDHVMTQWQTYAGSAVEPIVREALERLLPDARFGEARYVGSFWTRDHGTEVDLVGTDKDDTSQRVAFLGTVKWRERAPLDGSDTAVLHGARAEVPGADADTVSVGVSRTGFTDGVDLDVTLGPDDLLEAWR